MISIRTCVGARWKYEALQTAVGTFSTFFVARVVAGTLTTRVAADFSVGAVNTF